MRHQTFTIYPPASSIVETEYCEVVCGDRLNALMIRNVQLALITKGYHEVVASGKIDKSTKDALMAFQESQNIPSGPLTVESMRLLGIGW